MTLELALDRTLLLMGEAVQDGVERRQLLTALTSTRIALVADVQNIVSHSAQTAFVTTAILMARSGHQVHLFAPDVPLIGPQPPLQAGKLISSLSRVGTDLLPDCRFVIGNKDEVFDLVIALGDSSIEVRSNRQLRLTAGVWFGRLSGVNEVVRWESISWPFGSLVAAALAAGEAFKTAMFKLPLKGAYQDVFREDFNAEFALADENAPCTHAFGNVDIISAGAITHSALYSIARVPSLQMRARIVEPDTSDLTNLNRYMMLLRSHLGTAKAEDIAGLLRPQFYCQPIIERFGHDAPDAIGTLAATVVVGVDDIPTRWRVQRHKPDWLGIGATSHWSAMASFHTSGAGCAHCLHYRDEFMKGVIPTTACVSFWSGLLLAAYLARHSAGEIIPLVEQQVFMTAPRPEAPMRSPVHIRSDCITCQPVPWRSS